MYGVTGVVENRELEQKAVRNCGKIICKDSAEGNFPQRIIAVLIAEKWR